MANRSNRFVSVKVDRNYFETKFEPERRRLEKYLGVNLSQTKFTEYLHRSNSQIKYPKRRDTFAPKRKRNGRLDFNI